jgi:proline dehydrogenase
MSAFDSLISRTLPWIPRPLMWRVARRYIAGLDFDAASRVIEGLARRGLRATVDVLGENVASREEAVRAREDYCSVLARIQAGGYPAGISIKLSQLGLKVDPALARENLESILDRAEKLGRFVRIDMEDSSTTEETIRIYREARQRHQRVGMVLQAYLRRTEADVEALLPISPDIRICKGIYTEAPGVAYQDYEEIRQNYVRVLSRLLEGDARVAIATHDPVLVKEGLRLSEKHDPEGKRHEFQMLLGVGEKMWDGILSANHRLRIYIPFGSHWHPYSLRRLRENPRIAGYIFRSLFRPQFLPG